MWTVTPTRMGWCRLAAADLNGAARFEPDGDGGLRVVELVLAGRFPGRPLDVVAQLGLWAAAGHNLAALSAALADRADVDAIEAVDEAERAEPRRRAAWGLGTAAKAEQAELVRLLTVEVPGDGIKPDGFFLEVAAAYAEACARSSTPAVLLAAANGVDPPRVRAWVKEARRRGLMPTARKSVA